MTLAKGARIVLAIAAAAVVTVVGYGAFIVSIHSPGPLQAVLQWVALPFFSVGAALGLVHGDFLAWLTIFAGFLCWTWLFVVLFSSRWWLGVVLGDQSGALK